MYMRNIMMTRSHDCFHDASGSIGRNDPLWSSERYSGCLSARIIQTRRTSSSNAIECPSNSASSVLEKMNFLLKTRSQITSFVRSSWALDAPREGRERQGRARGSGRAAQGRSKGRRQGVSG